MNILLLLLAIDSASIAHVVVAPGESLSVYVTPRSSSLDEPGGEPIVLLPGLLGGAFGFRKVTAILAAAGHSTFAIEPLGVGSSSHPDRGDYSLDAQADRIAAVLDTFAVTHAVIVGSNFGAAVALRLAYRHPGDGVRSVADRGRPRRSLILWRSFNRSSARAGTEDFWGAGNGTAPSRRRSPRILRRSILGDGCSRRCVCPADR